MTENENIPISGFDDEPDHPHGAWADTDFSTAGDSLTSLRIDLVDFKQTVDDIVTLLDSRTKNKSLPLTQEARILAGEVALGLPVNIVLDYRDKRIGDAFKTWHERRRVSLSVAARNEAVLLRKIVESAICSTQLLDAMGADVSAAWSNLPPALLARSINGYVHAMTQRLPGWEDAG